MQYPAARLCVEVCRLQHQKLMSKIATRLRHARVRVSVKMTTGRSRLEHHFSPWLSLCPFDHHCVFHRPPREKNSAATLKEDRASVRNWGTGKMTLIKRRTMIIHPGRLSPGNKRCQNIGAKACSHHPHHLESIGSETRLCLL